MKAVVTGANGLIGSNLARELVRQGHSVRAVVRPTSDLRSLEGVEVEKRYGDILDTTTLETALKGCDILFHVAAVFSYWKYKPEEIITIAEQGTINIIEAAKRVGIKKIIFTSSSVVFGSTRNATILDEDNTAPEPNPPPYITAKIVQEKAGFKKAAELGIDCIAVCPTICVGPHDYGLSESNSIIVNYLNDPLKSTWPGGCNIVSVKDVADGHILAAEKGATGESYILGSQNMNWCEIHSMISGLCGVDGPLMTANHTTSYLAATYHELTSMLTGKRPLATRVQAKMVGRYYWYNHQKASAIGFNPMPARSALAGAVSWLAKSDHIHGSLRNNIRLSNEVYAQR